MPQSVLVPGPVAAALPIWPVASGKLAALIERVPARHAAWLRSNRFAGEAGELLLLPEADGAIAGAYFGLGRNGDPFVYGALPGKLPPGVWRLDGIEAGAQAGHAALAFL